MARNDEADFAAYLAARWSSVVRTIVLLAGCSRAEAEEAALAGFARCYAEWGRISGEADLDTQVWSDVLPRARATPVPVSDAEPVLDAEPVPDAEPVLVALQAELERLGAEAREVLVLTFVADLDEPQVAELLDLSVYEVAGRGIRARAGLDLTGVRAAWGRDDGAMSAAEAFRLAAGTVDAGAAPYDEVVARARAARRRRRRTALVVGAVVVLVAAVLTWVGTRSSGQEEPRPEPLRPVAVQQARNAVDVAWYAAGRLHLDDVSVALPQLTDLVELGGGAVYGDQEGTVAFVDADGGRRLLGEQEPGTGLVASSGEDWVAWLAPRTEGSEDRTIVLYDVAAGQEVDRRTVRATDLTLVAIDQRRVFYTADGTSSAWTPGVDEAETLVRELVDAESATRVYQDGRRIDMTQSLFNVDFSRPGIGGLLSYGGGYVLSREPAGDTAIPGAPYRPLLYDALAGNRLPSGVARDERVVDATFGDTSAVVYLVARAADLVGSDLDGNIDPLLVLRRCDIGVPIDCTDVLPVPSGTDRPLLAH